MCQIVARPDVNDVCRNVTCWTHDTVHLTRDKITKSKLRDT